MSQYLQLQAPRSETIFGLVFQRFEQWLPNSQDLIEVVNLQAKQMVVNSCSLKTTTNTEN